MLDGGAGVDTVGSGRAESYPLGVQVNLATGKATGGLGSDTLKNFENVTGSRLDDVLTGNSGANVLDGGNGSDTLDGGAGVDTASFATYFGTENGVFADLSLGVAKAVSAGSAI